MNIPLIIEKAAVYLQQCITPSGKFIYIRGQNGTPVKGKYNILRHAGAIWALKETWKVYPSLINGSLLYCAEHWLNKHVEEFGIVKGKYLVHKQSIKLGGMGLTILALGKQHPNSVELTRGLKDLFLGPKGALLGYKYDLNEEDFTSFQSEYYPGEAALALATMGELTIAVEILLNLQKTQKKVIHDHWALQAIAKCLEDPNLLTHKKKALVDYAKQIAHAIIHEDDYWDWKRVTPIACRAEGLIAYLKICDSNPAKITLGEMVEFMADFQSESGLTRGGFMENTNKQYRIDYTQHCLSAFLGYQQLFNK